MSSNSNKKTSSTIRILSRIKSPGKCGWLIRILLKKKWKSLWPIHNSRRKCCKEKSMARPLLPSRTQSATSRTSSGIFKNSKLQSINVWPCSTNWQLWSRPKDNKLTQLRRMWQEQRITLKRQRKNCKRQRSIISVRKSVCALGSL